MCIRRRCIRVGWARWRRRSCSPTIWSRLIRVLDFVKKAVPMNDDVFDFFYEALPGYEEVGRRRVLLGCWGAFQDPAVVRLRLPSTWTSGAGRCS